MTWPPIFQTAERGGAGLEKANELRLNAPLSRSVIAWLVASVAPGDDPV
jgi:hypothetical protein